MSHRRGHEMLRSTFHVEVRVGPAKRDAVKEADPVPGAVAALPGEPALLVQVEQVVLDLLGGDPLGTASLEAREPGDGVEIRAYRVLREAANGHVVDHAFAQTCHVSSPLSVNGHGEHWHRCAEVRPKPVGRISGRDGNGRNDDKDRQVATKPSIRKRQPGRTPFRRGTRLSSVTPISCTR